MQGDGNALIFQNDPAVFTFSMHGEGNFPTRKQSSDLDIPLPDGTSDDDYLRCAKVTCSAVTLGAAPVLQDDGSHGNAQIWEHCTSVVDCLA
jgi:acetoin utilization deacetylase AcuC-like enzyme